MVSRTSRAHLCVICEGHITSVVRAALCENVDRAERHERLARAALGDDARGLCLAQIFCGPGDGQRLGG